jgi:hypothetical protein
MVLDVYITPSNEILHTQDKEYIIEDILNIIKEREVEI